MTTKLS